MAPSRSKVQVGSAPWILSERRQANEFVDQEAEEFSYSVRNEMEWLNEHMADIFSKTELNVADVFKTPGKLRGKTPRTARKRNPLETRAPLTDIFAPNIQAGPSPAKNTEFFKQIAQFQVAEDPEPSSAQEPSQPSQSESQTHRAPLSTLITDSGYHGITDDEMEVDDNEEIAKLSPVKESPAKPAAVSSPPKPADENEDSHGSSFVSAKEDAENQAPTNYGVYEDEGAAAPDEDMDLVATQPDTQPEEPPSPHDEENAKSPQYSVGDQTTSAFNSIMRAEERRKEEEEQNQMDAEGTKSPSEGPSPPRQLLRKSSLAFSSLPAREPLAAKKSMGARVSRTSHVDQYKARSSHFGRFTHGKSLGGSQNTQTDHGSQEKEAEEDKSSAAHEASETTKTHNKTSTQLLHERINMLAQSQEPRTKSIPSSQTSTEPNYPQLPGVDNEDEPEPVISKAPAKAPSPVQNTQEDEDEDDDDDWIAPISSMPPPMSSIRPVLNKSRSAETMDNTLGKSSVGSTEPDTQASKLRSPATRASPSGAKHAKSSSSVPDFGSPLRPVATDPGSTHKKSNSVDEPEPAEVEETSTPAGSPSKTDAGALSASKSRFYSVLKSARSMFASSAGAGDQARLDAQSPAPTYPEMEEVSSPEPSRPLSSVFDKPVNPAPPASRSMAAPATPKPTEVRKTRSSTEREGRQKEIEARERERQEEEALEKEREKERQKAAAAAEKKKQKAKPSKESLSIRPGAASRAGTVSPFDEDYNSADEAASPPPAPKTQPSASKSQTLKQPASRLAKPSKESLKPVKESIPRPRTLIKVGLSSQRAHPSTADLSKSLQGTLPAPKVNAEPASNSFNKSITGASSSVAKPNSLALAAKNKEKEEREAQRKAEKKRAIEQQRAEKAAKAEEERRKADEERRAEVQRKAAEQQRAQEAKRAANRQALAAEAKKQEQMRSKAASRQGNDLAHALQQEKASTMPSHQRSDMPATRPISRMNTVQDMNLSRPVNPAKPPPKRMFQADDDEPVQRPQVPRNGPSFQRLDAKRRRTSEEAEEPAGQRRSMMAPPIRQSNIRKAYPDRDRIMGVIDKAKDVPSKFTHGYMAAPSGASSHTGSMFKQTVTAQHQIQHGKPSGHPNDMATISKAKIPFADSAAAPGPSASAAGPSSHQFKTPMRVNTTTTTVKTASPHFPTPELPDIATDSEDEDSDAEASSFQAPSWVNSPALKELLSQQQLVDPMEVFGPIPPLQMEEIFKNKDRHKRFRERTSSAHWTADKLTEEERKKDREGRKRLMEDGGWTYRNAS
ncbi:uncharacterized protein K452DRAFT_311809 [Aplosporella prunicola CBS 121167]|uniref:Inner centromere protein ARK-binding domain-containing protein n=1 Tax=Aplosporella prunicola CBS 121167 TaxID=1176127 RepID=A0A6A6B439_9PEZI|nr:uncharacterized protein K452DRAFT_311809 [Aplosporella prunicola CBS 121167]KAF2138025.1 hypothetical protein K452DRAFT_311809 [Aplosporella prunicola CBS 121167]